MGVKIQSSRDGIIFSIDRLKRMIGDIVTKELQLTCSHSFIFFVLASMIAFPAKSQDTYISAAETLAYGIFTSVKVKKYAKGSTKNAPPADEVSQYQFQEFTTQIPMELGTDFGIEYQLNSKPAGKKLPITTIIHFPEPGLVQPKGRTYRKSVERKMVRIGQPALHGYGFDEAWELVPGEWTFEVWLKNTKLISKVFTVVDSSKTK